MALVVETGAGLSNAESYGSVAEADAYHTAFGNTSWTGTTPEKEVKLRRGSQALDNTYHEIWKGVRKNSTQALDWPRYGVTDRDGYALDGDALPTKLKNACFEMALRSAEDPMPDIDVPGSIRRESFKVGPIEESTTYEGGASQIPAMPKLDALVMDLIEDDDGTLERC